MNIATNITQLIGHTPLLELSNIQKIHNINSKLFAKLEYFNPAGSVKDRVAMNMIEVAEKSGKLTKDTTIIEPTSGNTGIGLAAIAASKGYHMVVTMPETMSIERRKLISAYGAEIVLTPASEGMTGAIKAAEKLSKEISNSILAGQFVNPANPQIHAKTTGPEIWQDTNGCVDVFISAVGTGGTITGVGTYLKEKKSDIKVIAVEPAASPVLSGGTSAPHKIQGIGAGFVPEILDTSVIDEIVQVENDEAFTASRELSVQEGILVGISSGAAVAAALKICSRNEYFNKNIVIILPDTGERYLSTELFV